MKKTIITILFSLPAVLLCGQDTSAVSLSLDSCKAMALKHSKEMAIAEKTKEKAKAEKNAVLSMYFPKVEAIGGAMYAFSDMKVLSNINGLVPDFAITDGNIPDNLLNPINEGLAQMRNDLIDAWKPIEVSLKGAYLAGVTLTQPVYAGGRIVTGNNMAKTAMRMADSNLAMKRDETLLDAEKTYWLYVSIGEKVKLAESYDTLLQNIETLVENAVNVEMKSMSDLMQVRVQRNKVTQQLQMARNGLLLSRMALCRIVGLDYSTPIVTQDSTINSPAHYGLTPDDAVYNRNEYRLLQDIVKMKDLQTNLVMGEYLPSIGIMASAMVMGGIKINGESQGMHNGSSVMATAQIPITHWWEGSQKIKSAKADKVIAELEMEKNIELMRLEIEQATLNMIAAWDQIERAQTAVDAAMENWRIAKDRYEMGLSQTVELLNAQTEKNSAENSLIDAKIDYQIAMSTWKKATGTLSD